MRRALEETAMINRICLIDDDVVVLEALALGLRDAGFAVLTAPGAVAGLDLIQRGGTDAIVTDMNMPGTSGAQLIAEARASWPDTPIIAISGAPAPGGQSMLDAARALGADALLLKPFRVAELKEVLDRILAAKAAGQYQPSPLVVR
jgi:DNA-binding response OmpR family regulator